MAATVDGKVIKTTQDLLGRVIKKPQLTDKLLGRPPFKFLHDIIANVIRSNESLKLLYTADEMRAEGVTDKEAKIAFLQKIISLIQTVNGGKPLAAKPSKIVAGLEPEKTNELLQALAKMVSGPGKGRDFSEFVNQVLEGKVGGTKSGAGPDAGKKTDPKKPAARTTSKERPAPKATPTTNGRGPGGSGSGPGRSKKPASRSVSRDRRDSSGGPGSATGGSRERRQTSVIRRGSYTKEKKADDVDLPNGTGDADQQPVTTEVQDPVEQNPPAAAATATDLEPQATKLVNGNSADNDLDAHQATNHVAENDDKSPPKPDSGTKSKPKISDHPVPEAAPEPDPEPVPEAKPEPRPKKEKKRPEKSPRLNKKPDEGQEKSPPGPGPGTGSEEATERPARPKTARAAPPKIVIKPDRQPAAGDSHEGGDDALDGPMSSSVDLPAAVTGYSETESRTRLLTAKPIRNLITTKNKPKSDNDSDQDEDSDDTYSVGKRGADGKSAKSADHDGDEDDDDDDPFAKLAGRGPAAGGRLAATSGSGTGSDTGRGVLVKQLMETKRELEGGSGAQSGTADTTDPEAERWLAKDIEQLRVNVQSLAQVANPVGRILEYLYEDVDTMLAELKQWHDEWDANRTALDRERTSLERTLTPLRAELAGLDREQAEKCESIAAVRVQVLRNEERIIKLFSAGNFNRKSK